MKKYIKNLVFFIVSSIIITFVFSAFVQGNNSVISLQNKVYLTDKAVEKEVILYNFLNEGVYFNLKLNTSPFNSDISQDRVFIPANEYKTIKYTIYPLNDSKGEVYSGSLETIFQNNRFIEYFTIEQAFNKKCDISVDISSNYLSNENYSVKILFKNTNSQDRKIIVQEIDGILQEEKEIFVLKNSEYSYEKIISSKQKNIDVKYLCNDVILTSQVSLEKPIRMSGYFSLNWANNFLESIYFKILLIVILILLVLSFSTRYLRYINRR